MTDTASEFDYVIVGAGSAGCVLANRLSADPANRVALLEAGGRDNWIWFHIPVGYLFAIGNPRADWMFRTEPVPGLNGRTLAYPRGKVIGGSSAINAMIYIRGQSEDYDGWRQLGLEGWGWDDVKPLMMGHQDHHGGVSEHHGTGGEWRVDRPRLRWDILDAFIEAAADSGIPRSRDFNTGDNEGVGYFEVNQKGGRRWSSGARLFEAGAASPQPDAAHRRGGGSGAVCGLPCHRRRLPAGRGRASGERAARSDPFFGGGSDTKAAATLGGSAPARCCDASASRCCMICLASGKICKIICRSGRSTRSRGSGPSTCSTGRSGTGR